MFGIGMVNVLTDGLKQPLWPITGDDTTTWQKTRGHIMTMTTPAGQPPSAHRPIGCWAWSTSSTSFDYPAFALATWHSPLRPGRQCFNPEGTECSIIILIIGNFESWWTGLLSWPLGNSVQLPPSTRRREHGTLRPPICRLVSPSIAICPSFWSNMIRFGAIFQKSPAAAGRVCETSQQM